MAYETNGSVSMTKRRWAIELQVKPRSQTL
jgi:hypothetical protein